MTTVRTKSEKLEIRLTVGEKELLYGLAGDMKLSDYVKGVLFGGVIPERQVDEPQGAEKVSVGGMVHQKHLDFPRVYNEHGHKWGCVCLKCKGDK